MKGLLWGFGGCREGDSLPASPTSKRTPSIPPLVLFPPAGARSAGEQLKYQQGGGEGKIEPSWEEPGNTGGERRWFQAVWAWIPGLCALTLDCWGAREAS